MGWHSCLCDLQPAESGLLDIGLVNNTLVECLGRSPAGDPSAYLIRGAVIALRAQDCRQIILADN